MLRTAEVRRRYFVNSRRSSGFRGERRLDAIPAEQPERDTLYTQRDQRRVEKRERNTLRLEQDRHDQKEPDEAERTEDHAAQKVRRRRAASLPARSVHWLYVQINLWAMWGPLDGEV